MIEFLLDDRELYRESAEDLLETQFEVYKVEIESLLVIA
jgi:hypothetical protein